MFIYVCLYACVYKFHSLKAMQDFHSFMYVCIYTCLQRDFRLMSFTAGHCGTPLIPNNQLRRNGVRSSDLIPNDQLRRNGVRSSDLIVSVSPSRPSGKKSRTTIACTPCRPIKCCEREFKNARL